jgi:formylglycine-generating enzyme required for sulfatase activity
MRTHYENLKVAENAPDEVIKAAYRALCQKYHPDKNSGDAEAHRIMQIINAAYAVLSDTAQRSRYDESLKVRRQREAADARKSAPPPFNRSAPPPAPPPPAPPHEDVRANARANPKQAATAGNASSRPDSNTNRVLGWIAAVIALIFLVKANWTEKAGGGSESDLESASEMAALGRASKSAPFTNSLGMKFVPVPGTEVLFCIHETRSRDYAAFMADRNRGYTMSGDSAANWRTGEVKQVPVGRGVGERAEQSNHPVASVSWLDAVAFCDWLSKKEGKTYRLPTDREWSVAVGIPQEGDGTPNALDSKIADVYPWGGSFVAAWIQGNYADAAAEAKGTAFGFIEGYRDGFATTAPVMSFPANVLGLYDMGGNLFEWCAGCYNGTDAAGKDRSLSDSRVVRGGSWFHSDSAKLLSSYRNYVLPSLRFGNGGFRVVVVGRSGG